MRLRERRVQDPVDLAAGLGRRGAVPAGSVTVWGPRVHWGTREPKGGMGRCVPCGPTAPSSPASRLPGTEGPQVDDVDGVRSSGEHLGARTEVRHIEEKWASAQAGVTAALGARKEFRRCPVGAAAALTVQCPPMGHPEETAQPRRGPGTRFGAPPALWPLSVLSHSALATSPRSPREGDLAHVLRGCHTCA